MIDSFAGLFSSFGALQDITKSLLELRDFQQLNAKVIEFQQVIPVRPATSDFCKSIARGARRAHRRARKTNVCA